MCIRGSAERKKEKEMCVHAQKLLAVDLGIRPTVTDAYEFIYFHLY